MADLRCDFCELEPAAFIISNTANGETQGACPADLARLGLELAKSLLPPEEILDRLGIAPAAPAADPEAEATPKRGRKSKAANGAPADPGPAAPEGVAEEPTTAPNGGDTGL